MFYWIGIAFFLIGLLLAVFNNFISSQMEFNYTNKMDYLKVVTASLVIGAGLIVGSLIFNRQSHLKNGDCIVYEKGIETTLDFDLQNNCFKTNKTYKVILYDTISKEYFLLTVSEKSFNSLRENEKFQREAV